VLTKILGAHLNIEKVIAISNTGDASEWNEKIANHYIDVNTEGGGCVRLYGKKDEVDAAREEILSIVNKPYAKRPIA